MIGIHPDNQAPELKDYNVYTSDPVLRLSWKVCTGMTMGPRTGHGTQRRRHG